jgi:hypothetical protein
MLSTDSGVVAGTILPPITLSHNVFGSLSESIIPETDF